MRTEDLEAGRARSTASLDVIIKDGPAGPALTPAASVVAAAFALAAIAHLAECGSGAARVLFEGFYESMGEMLNSQNPRERKP